jgi:hypothetical protein
MRGYRLFGAKRQVENIHLKLRKPVRVFGITAQSKEIKRLISSSLRTGEEL